MMRAISKAIDLGAAIICVMVALALPVALWDANWHLCLSAMIAAGLGAMKCWSDFRSGP